MTRTQPSAAQRVADDNAAGDFAALKRACDGFAPASGLALWRMARQIAQFARAHNMTGVQIAQGLDRSRGWVSRALKAARPPEPVTIEEAQYVYRVFHGWGGVARRAKDAAEALKLLGTWSRTALKRGASPDDLKRAVEQAIAAFVPMLAKYQHVSIYRNNALDGGSDYVSINRNTHSEVKPEHGNQKPVHTAQEGPHNGVVS